MRAALALVLLSALLAGCTSFIPVKDDFGTSALAPRGETSPEFAKFNNYDPSVNALVANQICATPYEQQQTRSYGASPGGIAESEGRCQTHIPLLGP
jgi:hypothetical protein